MKEKTKILVVDDDPELLLLTSTVLSRGGYEVIEASFGKDALELARQARPGLVLLDVMLPDMSGLDICKQIKADPELRSTLVVLLSGVSTSSDAQARGLDLGADGYIVKPIPNKELLARVHSLVRIREAEEALKISETQYRRLFETAQDGILILDADTGLITDVNPFLMDMLGYSFEDFIGKKLWEIGAFEDVEASKAVFSELQSRGYVRYEDLPLETTDGQHIDVEFVSNVYTVDHRNVIQCNIRDITERKRAEDQLGQKTHELGERVKELNCLYTYSQLVERPDIHLQEIFQGLVDIIPPGWQYPESTCARLVLEDNTFKTANFTETVWKQSSPILVDGRHSGELEVYYLDEMPELAEGPFLKEERELIDALAGRLGQTIMRIRAEEALQHAHDKLERRVEERTAELLRANERLAAEIEDRREAEEEVRQSQERYHSLFTAMAEGVVLQAADGAIIACNAAAERILGLSADQMMGRTSIDPGWNAIHEDGSPFPGETHPAMVTLRTGRPCSGVVMGVHKPDGSLTWVSINAQPIFQPGDIKHYAVVATFTEITERKQAERSLRESEAALRASQDDLRRLAGRLLFAEEEERRRVARELHDDFTQRLAVLAIEAGKLERELSASGGPANTRMATFREQMVRLSSDVHRLSRRLHPTILDDLGLIKAVEAECTRFSQQEGLDVGFVARDVTDALAKETALSLYRVLQESLRNVVKHARTKEARVSLIGDGDVIRLSVEDDGEGFDPGLVRKRGGLGLASMEERMRLVGGKFTIDSHQGKGTLITVEVPVERIQGSD